MASYDVVLLLLGPTRSGKTTFANLVAKPLDRKPGASNTTACKDYDTSIAGKKILIIDTPGFDDSPTVNLAILNSIAEKVARTPGINGVVYFQRVTNTRLTGSARSNIEVFRQICGSPFYGQTAFVTTMWNTVNPSQLERFKATERQLRSAMAVKTNGLIKCFAFNSSVRGAGTDVLLSFTTLDKISVRPAKLQLFTDLINLGSPGAATPSSVRKTGAGKQIMKEMNRGICIIL